MKNTSALLQAQNLIVSRQNRKVLDISDFAIRRGEPFAIIGESGSGKTTLLSALTGLLSPQGGKIEYQGKSLFELNAAERATIFGLVFQDYQLFPHLTVLENVMIAPKVRQLPIKKDMALSLLEQFGISSLAERYPREISGGQKQRVAIARSLILEPLLLFLDEPSAALDEKTTQQLSLLLRSLNEKTQIIAVSHDRNFLRSCCTRGILLQKGEIAVQGSLQEILEKANQ